MKEKFWTRVEDEEPPYDSGDYKTPLLFQFERGSVSILYHRKSSQGDFYTDGNHHYITPKYWAEIPPLEES